jgi:hypothetical protein
VERGWNHACTTGWSWQCGQDVLEVVWLSPNEIDVNWTLTPTRVLLEQTPECCLPLEELYEFRASLQKEELLLIYL